jgi:cold shock CspA family protein
MSDEWRLKVDVHEEGHARALTDRLEAAELEHDLSRAFHDRVFISRKGAEVLCYTDGREQAEGVKKLIESLASEHGWHIDCELTHWHSSTARFEPAGAELTPEDAKDVAAHHAAVERERAESLARGDPEFEVKVEFPSHHDARKLEAQLGSEGIPNAHRWKYLVVGALDEDSGEQLRRRILAESPEGTTATVEASVQSVLADMPRRHSSFALFGGLGA